MVEHELKWICKMIWLTVSFNLLFFARNWNQGLFILFQQRENVFCCKPIHMKIVSNMAKFIHIIWLLNIQCLLTAFYMIINHLFFFSIFCNIWIFSLLELCYDIFISQINKNKCSEKVQSFSESIPTFF